MELFMISVTKDGTAACCQVNNDAFWVVNLKDRVPYHVSRRSLQRLRSNGDFKDVDPTFFDSWDAVIMYLQDKQS